MSAVSSEFKGLPNHEAILGHKPGLFVLFFTEMWERFSYYGMRALLVLFLIASIYNDGWGWARADAMRLYAFYTGLVYLTPIFGGILADKLLGYRKAVVLGALIMTVGHAAMAFETPTAFYVGLACLIIGNGLFKPNISSIVGQLYKDEVEKRDAAYTIFYMGINSGAFLGILLCGYVGEKVSWSYGFGLAGIFMLLGMIQFYFAQGIFGKLGLKPEAAGAKPEPDAESEEADADEVPANVERDRMIVIGVFAFFTVFFWWAFEQAGGSMTIFAKDYTQRVLEGNWAIFYKACNTFLTVVPLIVLTWVLGKLFKVTFGDYPQSNLCLGASFVVVWAIALWSLADTFKESLYKVSYTDQNGIERTESLTSSATHADGAEVDLLYAPTYEIYDSSDEKNAENKIVDGMLQEKAGKELGAYFKTSLGDISERSLTGLFWKKPAYSQVSVQTKSGRSVQYDLLLPDDHTYKVGDSVELLVKNSVDFAVGEPVQGENRIKGKVLEARDAVEVTASWFQILNSFFIIVCAPFFSRFWEKNIIRSGPVKFAMGLILLGMGFAALAFGSMSIEQGAKTASVSMIWLVLAYLFHTLGELCLSPVGLSYVSKLAPARLVGLMFGIWFVANFVANFAAGITGSYIDAITESFSMSVFFLIFTLIPIGAGVVLILLNSTLKRMMHGVE